MYRPFLSVTTTGRTTSSAEPAWKAGSCADAGKAGRQKGRRAERQGREANRQTATQPFCRPTFPIRLPAILLSCLGRITYIRDRSKRAAKLPASAKPLSSSNIARLLDVRGSDRRPERAPVVPAV